MAEESRKGLFRIHAWIGLNLGFLLFVICFSGTVAVFSAELTWLIDRSWRAEPPPDGSRASLSWQDMHDRVSRAHPYALVLYLSAPSDERTVARAAIGYSSTDVRWVLINPNSGDLQGHKSGFNLESFFRIFHKQLYIVPSVHRVHGTLIVGAFAILLLASAITGILSMKRWWRAFLTLRQGRSARLFWSDLHRFTGVWPLVVTIVLSLTGIWYLAERILLTTGTLVEDTAPARLGSDDLRRRPAVLEPLNLDRAAALAKAAYPDLTIRQIALPRRPGDPLVFTGQAEAWLVRDRANQVQMDPYTGEILQLRHATDLGMFERWLETADRLHFGIFAGTISQWVWFISGLMLCGGILTGLYTAWLRLRQQGRPGRKTRRLAAAASTLPTVLLLLASVHGTWAYGGEALRSAQRSVNVVPLSRTELGAWKIAIDRFDAEASSSGSVNLRISFTGQGRPNFERAVFWIGDRDQPTGARSVTRFVDRLLAQARCPPDNRAGECRFNLRLTEWGGAQHSVSIDLSERTEAETFRLPVATGMSPGEIAVIAAFAACLLLPLGAWVRLQFL